MLAKFFNLHLGFTPPIVGGGQSSCTRRAAVGVQVRHCLNGALHHCDEGLVHVPLRGLHAGQGVKDAVPDLRGGEVCLRRFTRDL